MLTLMLELLFVLGLLVWADAWLHRRLQGILLLLTNDAEIAIWLYAIVLLPGVVLHEISHAITAWILGVKIGRLNILPRRIGKRIQLGFVPVATTDFVRASVIGAAPLCWGGVVVMAIGYVVFGTPAMLTALATADWVAALRSLYAALHAPDGMLWAYIVFTVANTMLPSRSDIHAWPVTAGLLVLLSGIALILGGSTFVDAGIKHFLTIAVRGLVLLGGSTFLIDVPFFGLIAALQWGIQLVKGVRLEYR